MGETEEEKKKGIKVLEGAPDLKPADYRTVQGQYDAGASQIAGSAESTAQAIEGITGQQVGQMQTNLAAMQAANTQADAAAQASYNDFDTILQNMEQARQAELDKQKAANDKANRQDYNARVAGGLGETAAALINLIGAARGGTAAQWTSPQQEWAQRADAYRREREARFDNLRSQLDNLAMQRAQIQYQFGQGRAQQMRSDAAANMGAANSIVQVQSAGQMQAAGTRQSGMQAAVNAALQGVNAGVSQFNTNRAYSQTAAAQAPTIAAANDNLATQRYMLGYYDTTAHKWVPSQATKEEREAWIAAAGKSSKADKATSRNLRTQDGQYVPVSMTDDQYNQAFDQARRELEDEIEQTKGKSQADIHRGKKDSEVRNEVEARMVASMQAAQASQPAQTGGGAPPSTGSDWWK